MAVNWNLYDNRVNICGNTTKERVIHNFQTMRNKKGLDSPSSKTVMINGVEKQVFILSKTTNKAIKSISPVINTDTLILGSKVQWKDIYWLITELNLDDDVLIDGTIQQCNYTLPFQTTSSTIFYEPCIIVDATRTSSTGESETKIITLSDTQRVVYIQYNENTKYLVEEKRLFIDQFADVLKTYKITNVDRVTYMNGSNGLLKLTCDVSETTDKDNVALKIADYISTDPYIPPTPTTAGASYITNTRDVVYTQAVELKIGGEFPKPFVALFKDVDGNAVEGISPKWGLVLNAALEGKVHLTYNADYSNRAYVAVDDQNALIGETFSLVMTDIDETYKEFVVTCKVVSFT